MKQLYKISILIFITCAFAQFSYAQPANDDCENATEIVIGNDGYELDTFTTAYVDMSDASIQLFEVFFSSLVSAGNDKKSVWFKFTLPTRRFIEISLAQKDTSIKEGEMGFTLYKTSSCIPALADIEPAKLAPLPKFGSTSNQCVSEGTYYLQVATNADLEDSVYINLITNYPFLESFHDFGDSAFYNGIIDYEYTSGSHYYPNSTGLPLSLGCYSLDSVDEKLCPDIGNDSADYNQSIWQVFRTDDYIDVLRFELRGSGYDPKNVGVNIFLGDVREQAFTDMPIVSSCNVFDMSSTSWQYLNLKCVAIPDTIYSVQVLVHEDVDLETMYTRIAHVGSAATLGANPSSLPANNQLGSLTGGGATTSASDVFSCNAYIAGGTPDNTCGSVNPAGATDTLNTWYTFTLSTDAYVIINTSGYNMKRLYDGDVDTDCNLTSPISFTTHSYIWKCMPAGTYSLQILGTVSEGSILDYRYSRLGRDANVSIRVYDLIQVNDFDLGVENRVDSINDLDDMVDGITYYATTDRFGCNSTRMPTDMNCGAYTKTSYRILEVGDGDVDGFDDTTGILYVSGGNYWLRHNLFEGDASEEMANQGWPVWPGAPETIDNLNPISTCWSAYYRQKFCVVPGKYTLATFATDNHIGYSDRPTFRLDLVQTEYRDPANPYDYGDITATIQAGGTVTHTDYFDCYDNPLTLCGLAPCNNKQIYRQFYLATSLILNIRQSGSGTFRIFNGKISESVDSLSIFSSTCRTSYITSVCSSFPAGWYTLVSYGSGGTATGSTKYGGDIGNSNRIYMNRTVAIDPPNYNRPYKAYYAGVTDIGVNDLTDSVIDYDTSYTFGLERFNCQDDEPLNQWVNECSGFNRVAFYVFTLTKESYAYVYNINSTHRAQLYAGDVRADTNLKDNELIQTCLQFTDIGRYNGSCGSTWDGKMEICRIQPGDYTLVVYASDYHINRTVQPKLYVDTLKYSQHDFASNAYDFGIVPGDSIEHYNNATDGDTGIVAGRNASNDFFSCTTGAHEDDPVYGCALGDFPGDSAWSINYPVGINENHYATLTTEVPIRRNLWYTFQISGPGRVTTRAYNMTPGKTTQYPYAIYRSDESFTGDFSALDGTANKDIDSTLAQGLTLVGSNYRVGNCWGYYCYSVQSTYFDIPPCDGYDTVRYYMVVYKSGFNQPISQVEVSIQFDDLTPVDVEYDWYSQANDINAEYSKTYLDSGLYVGDTATFACAQWDTILYNYGGSVSNPCDTNSQSSLWYKFTVDIAGKIRANYSIIGGGTYYSSTQLKMFKEITAGDSIEPGLDYQTPTTVSYDGKSWGEICMSPGTYYLILTGCAYEIEQTYPNIWIVDQDGDLCANPVYMVLSDAGEIQGNVNINCHTIGDDFGEDESSPNMGCLFGPTDYKSTWFKVLVSDTAKLDLNFALDESTSAFPSQIRYRMMYGTCGAMTAHTCNNDAGTEFTLNCMKGDSSEYFLQVVSPYWAMGDLTMTITGSDAPNQSCSPMEPGKPNANFTYTGTCQGDSTCFSNQSTQGEDIAYHWDFGTGVAADTSILFSPCFLYTGTDEVDTFNVRLIATNTESGKADTVFADVFIFRTPTTTGITNNAASLGDHQDTLRTDIEYEFNGNPGNTITNPVTTYNWNMGDGTTYTDETNPYDFTYCTSCLGMKIITFEMWNGTCMKDTTDTLTVGAEAIFGGGFYDGATYDSLKWYCPPEEIWGGGFYDGESNEIEEALCAPEEIWGGGFYDGESNELAESTCIPLEEIWGGGFYDGASSIEEEGDCAPEEIWGGGFYDGASDDIEEASCPLEDIWSGGFYDGESVSHGQITVEIDGVPMESASDTICIGDVITIDMDGWGDSLKYVWNTGDTTKNITRMPVSDVIYSVTITVYSDFVSEVICAVIEKDIYIYVADSAIADAGADKEICNGQSVQIGTTALNGYSVFEWSSAASLNDETLAQPIATVPSTTTYTVTVGDQSGVCPDATDNVIVTTTAFPTIDDILSDSNQCTGVNIDLTSSVTSDSLYWFKDYVSVKVPVYIENSSGGDLADYQIKVLLNTSQLIADGMMQADCDDISVYDADDTTPLDFWIADNTCDSAYTEIWIKKPSIIGSVDRTSGGTPSASTTSGAFVAANAFDGDVNTQWTNTAIPTWLEYDYAAGTVVNKYKIYSGGNALHFDGSADYVRVPDNNTIDLDTGSFTVEAWIKPSSTGNTPGRVVDHRGSGSGGSYAGFQLKVGRSGTNWRVDDSGIDDADGNYKARSGGYNYSCNEWHHIAMVYDNTELRYYVDGVLDGTVSVGSSYGDISNALPLSIGAAISANGAEGSKSQYFNGEIDEVRLWDVAWSQAQIQSRMNNEITGNEAWLLAYWNFNEATGAAAADASTNTNDGTLNNMTNSDWYAGSVGNVIPKTWIFQGYNGSSWVTLDSVADGSLTAASWNEFSFYNITEYTKYRINVSAAESGDLINIQEVELIDTKQNTTMCYVHYGDADATSQSNGENTFIFFDDFNASTINTAKWQVHGSYESIDNNMLKVSGGTSSWNTGMISQSTFVRDDWATVARYKSTGGTNHMWGVNVESPADYAYNRFTYNIYSTSTNWNIYEYANSRGDFGDMSNNIWYDLKVKVDSTTGADYFYSSNNGTSWNTLYNSSYETNTPLRIGYAGYSRSFLIDFWFIKKAADSEPVTIIGDAIYESVLARTSTVTISDSASYILMVSNDGCPSVVTDTVWVKYYAQPVAAAGNDTSACEGGTVQLGTSLPDYLDFAWTPSASLDDATLAQPTSTPTATTTYSVIVETADGVCLPDTDEVIVSVQSLPDISDIHNDTSLCTGVSIDLTSTVSADSIYWFDGFVCSRQPVTLSYNNLDATTDLPVKMILNTASLVSSGKLQSACEDLRIFDTDGTTELDFWIADGTCNTTITEIWVKIPSLAAASTCGSNLATGGTAQANFSHTTSPAADAFNGDRFTDGWANNGFMPAWLKYDYGDGNGVVVNRFRMYCSSTQNTSWNSENYNPMKFTIQGSNDEGATWSDFHEIPNARIVMDAWFDYRFNNTTTYEQYRIYITQNESGNSVRITELEFYNCTPVTRTIYLTYGDAALSLASDGDAVFTFFDDFNSGLDATKWQISGSYQTIVDNRLYVTGGSSSWNTGMYTQSTFARGDWAVESRYKITGGTNHMWGVNVENPADYAYNRFTYNFYSTSSNWNIYEYANSRGDFGDNATNRWYDLSLRVDEDYGADYLISEDNGDSYSVLYSSNYETNTPLRIGYAGYSRSFLIDFWYIRSTVQNPPAFTVEAEEYCDTLSRKTLVNVSDSANYVLMTKNTFCSILDVDSVLVKFYPQNSADAGDDSVLCLNNSVQIGTVTADYKRFIWSPSATLDNDTFAQPTATPSATTTYQVIMKNEYNICPSDTDTVIVTIESLPSIDDIISDTNFCDGPSVDLTSTINGDSIYWYSNSAYRKPITITYSPASGTATNYRVKLTVNTSALIAAGKMESDGADIRIKNSDGMTNLDFWIVDGTINTTTTEIWVELPSCDASIVKTIYMTYGNSALSSASNGDNVFVLFDDFNDGSIDAAKWEDGTTFTESGGYLLVGNTGTTDANRLKSVLDFTGNYTFETRHFVSSEASNGHHVGGWTNSGSNGFFILLHPTNTWYTREDGSWNGATSYNYMSEWLNIDISVNGTVGKARITRESDLVFDNKTDNANSKLLNEKISFGRRNDASYNSQAYDAKWDWMYVWEYTSYSDVSVVGAEEADFLSSEVLGRNSTLTTTETGTYLVYVTKDGCSSDASDTVDVTETSEGRLAWRTVADGDWDKWPITIWEVYNPNNSTWEKAEDYTGCSSPTYPTSADSIIQIRDSVKYNITIPSGIDETTIDADGVIVVEDGITLNMVDSSSSSITADITNNGKIYITGTFTAVGLSQLSNANTSYVIYNGTSAQDMIHSSRLKSYKFGNLWVDGGSIKTVVGTKTRVETDVKFIDGHIKLGEMNVFLQSNCTVSSYGNTEGYFITDGNAAVVKVDLGTYGTTTFMFPVGTSSTEYSPAEVTNTGTLDDIRVRVYDDFQFDGDFTCDALSDSYSVDKTWYLSEDSDGGSTISLKLYWYTAYENADFKPTDCYMGQYELTSGWEKVSANADVSALTPRYITGNDITTLTQYSVGSCGGSKYIYHTIDTGIWADATNWEIYIPEEDDWFPPASAPCTCGELSYPTSSDSTIYVRHEIDFETYISNGVDELVIESNGVLILEDSLRVVNGPGTDLDNNGKIEVQTKLRVVNGATFINDDTSIVHYSGRNQELNDVTFASLWLDGEASTSPTYNQKTLEGSNATVNDTLRFIFAIVDLEDNNFTMGVDAYIRASNEDSGWVNATGDGYFIWTYPTGSNLQREFPIGGGFYSPAYITFDNVTTGGILKGRVKENNWNNDFAGTAPGTLIDRYWTFTESGGSLAFDSYDAILQYDDFDLPSAPADYQEEYEMIEIGFAHSTAYSEAENWRISSEGHIDNIPDVNNNQFVLTNTAFSELSAGENPEPPEEPLPIELLKFRGTLTTLGVNLHWITLVEINNYGFFLERSLDGSIYENIAFIDGAGNTTERMKYSYLDSEILEHDIEVVYYRLKQIDFDGKITYSNIVPISIEKEQEDIIESHIWAIYPNPVREGNGVNIMYNLYEAGEVEIIICDIYGGYCYHDSRLLNRGKHKLWLSTDNLKTGMYFVRIRTNGNESVGKLIIQ